MILYATSPGDVAADGEGSNGLFTEKLMESMGKKGLTIERVFKQTAIKVSEASSRKQVPYIEGVILGYFYFHGDVNADEVVIKMPNAEKIIDKNIERDFWKEVKEDASIEMYEAYLESYPKDSYVPIAKIRLKKLKQNSYGPNTTFP